MAGWTCSDRQTITWDGVLCADGLHGAVGTIAGVPVLDQDIANKKYVDDEVAGVTGLWEVNGTTNCTQLKTADEINALDRFIYLDTARLVGMAAVGGNLGIGLGVGKVLDMNSRKITEVTDPTADQDAATKKYVDDNFASTTHAATHNKDGTDELDHDDLKGFVANEHINWVSASDNLTTSGVIEGLALQVASENIILYNDGTVKCDFITCDDTITTDGLLGTGNMLLDTGAGNSPQLQFIDGDDETLAIQKLDAGGSTITAAEDLTLTATAGNVILTGTDIDIKNGYPQRATMWHDEATVVNGNALTHAVDTASRYCTYSYQNAPADADSFTHSFLLKAGTYNFYVLGSTSSRGKIDWYFDGVKLVSGQDWYSAGTVKNVIKTTSVTVVGNGYHLLQGTINGKHASSASYTMALTKYWLWPATDAART